MVWPTVLLPVPRALPGSTAVVAAAASDPVRSGDTGYIHDLLRERGLSDLTARTIEFLLLRPLRIVVIVVVAVLVARWGGRLRRRAVRSLGVRSPRLTSAPRAEQRATTIADAIAGFWRVVVVIISALMILAEVGVNLVPLLAGASIAGLAIGFAAQTLIRDYLSGVFILAEDQYGVGDEVTVGTASAPVTTGRVEDVSLRVTRLRAPDGSVWFIPNGDIRALANRSLADPPVTPPAGSAGGGTPA